jgi:hypothetical protein
MGSGVLAYKTKKERLKPLFFMLDTFHARQSAGGIENSKASGFSFGRLGWRGLNAPG